MADSNSLRALIGPIWQVVDPLARILHKSCWGPCFGAEKKPYLFDIKGFNKNKQNKEVRLCLKHSASTHYPFTPTER